MRSFKVVICKENRNITINFESPINDNHLEQGKITFLHKNLNVTKEGNIVFCTLSLFFYVNVPECFFVILTNKIVLKVHFSYKACYRNNFSFPLFLWVSLTNDSLVLFA